MRKIFTIIKENSERVPKKNFRTIGGKPLWRWLIDELSDCKIYVNTDSDSLYNELKEFSHVIPVRRSEKHIEWEDNAIQLGSPVMDMVKEFCEGYLSESEDFALVHVTSPFLKAETLETAFKLYENSESHSLHSVKSIQDALMYEREGKVDPYNFTFDRVSRTQDLEPIYQSLGAFFIMNNVKLQEEKYKRLDNSTILFPLSPLESVEIDNEDDYLLAKLIAKSLKGNE